MNYSEKAALLHDSGYNCAQSVAGAFSDLIGMEQKQMLALAGGFGGGVRCGEICGAISGAVMVLGMLYPFQNGEDKEAKDRIARLTKTFTKAFEERFGQKRCMDLIKASGKRDCQNYIMGAAGILADMIENEKKEKENDTVR